MSVVLDTSVVVRYLTMSPPDSGRRAADLIDSADASLVVPPVTLLESAHVLTRLYRVPRAAAVDALIALVRKSNVQDTGLPKDLIVEALLLCRESGRVSFGDALHWAETKHRRDVQLATFDRRFPAHSIEVFTP